MSMVNFAETEIIAKANYLIRRTPGTQNLKCVDLSICPVRLLYFIRESCGTYPRVGQPRHEYVFCCPVSR